MRHQKKNRKFGREKTQRTALLRSLALSLVREGKIVTTEAKAKELRPYIEKLITQGKEGGRRTLRLAASRLGGSSAGAKSIREPERPYAPLFPLRYELLNIGAQFFRF